MRLIEIISEACYIILQSKLRFIYCCTSFYTSFHNSRLHGIRRLSGFFRKVVYMPQCRWIVFDAKGCQMHTQGWLYPLLCIQICSLHTCTFISCWCFTSNISNTLLYMCKETSRYRLGTSVKRKEVKHTSTNCTA